MAEEPLRVASGAIRVRTSGIPRALENAHSYRGLEADLADLKPNRG
jgi:hypothetical protein